ncbi:UTRA domain-containing protein [Limibaculum sp. FT325]|uniref:UTRA domain-containing protein n=1 Tax=Thermohalobaculum sediminis TaxID=2939436 RepID=UPI0020C09EF6|nr:UTRA domain-containing protein [Limibaculum sediminis]MCL5778310.1 UTRA domain-containing protein [Limibaculum sediminis]
MVTYRSIKAEILDGIIRRRWAPGDLIPNEEDLARDYGCSRSTVNRALQELADLGILERRRKAGTRVAQRTSRGALIQIQIVRNEIEQSGRRYGYVLLERAEAWAGSETAALIDAPRGAALMHLRCLHLADGAPWQIEDRLISLAALPTAREVDFEALSPNEWLVTQVPYSRSEHIFSAEPASAEERERLRLRPDEPVFVIERRTWLAGQALTYVRLSHPGLAYRMISREDDLLAAPEA